MELTSLVKLLSLCESHEPRRQQILHSDGNHILVSCLDHKVVRFMAILFVGHHPAPRLSIFDIFHTACKFTYQVASLQHIKKFQLRRHCSHESAPLPLYLQAYQSSVANIDSNIDGTPNIQLCLPSHPSHTVCMRSRST